MGRFAALILFGSLATVGNYKRRFGRSRVEYEFDQGSFRKLLSRLGKWLKFVRD